jgi:signal transduction histidine kinase
MGPWRLPAVRWPTLLLLVSVGLTSLGVVEASRAIRSQQAVAEHALRDYAGIAAWSYEQHLRDALGRAMEEVLGAVNHGDNLHQSPRIPDSRELAHYLPYNTRCGCHRPQHGPSPAIFFGWKLGTDTLGVGVNTHPDPAEGWEEDRPLPKVVAEGRVTGYTAAERRWINDTLTRQIRRGGDNGRFTVVVGGPDSVPRMFVYTLMPTVRGDTMVYGAEYARGAIASGLADVMYAHDLLPSAFTRGRSPAQIVQLRVSDARGRVLFESGPVREWALDDSARLAPAFGSLAVRAQIRPSLAGTLVIGGLLVRAQIRPELASTVVIGGLPRSRLPFLLGLLAVSAALAIVALGQIRREGELARLRENFVANISHELRTPLAQMRLYLETLRLGRFKTEDQRAWSLDNVERETTRLTQLVERVLRFSRTGRPDDDARDRVDAASEVQRIVEEFRPLAAARGASVAVHAEPVPPLLLRPAALRHIVLNLLDNAVKYGPAGQTIEVRVACVGGEVQIVVTDQGPGIAPADRTKVWKPYQRGRTAGHNAGSGIGLAVVRDVATAHGGRAWIEETSDGRGALFVVSLPAAGSRDGSSVARATGAPQPQPG